MPPASAPFSGVLPILATPFNDDESLDLHSLKKLVAFMGAAGADAVVVLGILGEADRLSEAERDRVVETAVAAAGQLPVIAGVNVNGTAQAVALCRRASELGAAGIMLAPIREAVPSDQKIFEFYKEVSASTSLPLCIQDHPASTQVHLSVPLILKMIQEIPGAASVKVEAVPSPGKFAALKKGMPRPGVTLLTGLGALYGLFDLERGSDGFMTGFAFPEILKGILEAWKRNDAEAAFRLYQRYLPLIVFEQQPGVAVRKEILRRRGLISSARVRRPGASIDPLSAEALTRLLERQFGNKDLKRPLALD